MPFAVADSLVARGAKPVLFALRGACDPLRVESYRHHWISVGQIGRATNCFARELPGPGLYRQPDAAGAVGNPARLGHAARACPGVAAFRGGDDHLLSGIGSILEQDGFRMVGIRDVAPDLLMPEGSLTRVVPDQAASADIARGRDVLQALGPYDVGQAVIVIDGHVVAVEDIEGTDGLLARVARLRGEGRIRGKAPRGVLVKAPKRGQDLRFDLPAIGVRTVQGAAAAGLAGIAIAAGNAVVAEPQAMIAAADAAGMFVNGISA